MGLGDFIPASAAGCLPISSLASLNSINVCVLTEIEPPLWDLGVHYFTEKVLEIEVKPVWRGLRFTGAFRSAGLMPDLPGSGRECHAACALRIDATEAKRWFRKGEGMVLGAAGGAQAHS